MQKKFEFPHFAIHRAKGFPSQSDGSALRIKDAYAAKGSKAFWHNNIGYHKKWGNPKKEIIQIAMLLHFHHINLFAGHVV